MFLIPTEDMKDPDAETHEVKPQPAPMKTDTRPVLTDQLFQKALDRITKGDTEVWPNVKATYQMSKVMFNTLESADFKLQ